MASHLLFLLASLPGNRHSFPHCLLHNDNYDMNFNFSQVLDYQNCLAMERLSGLSYNNQNCVVPENIQKISLPPGISMIFSLGRPYP